MCFDDSIVALFHLLRGKDKQSRGEGSVEQKKRLFAHVYTYVRVQYDIIKIIAWAFRNEQDWY